MNYYKRYAQPQIDPNYWLDYQAAQDELRDLLVRISRTRKENKLRRYITRYEHVLNLFPEDQRIYQHSLANSRMQLAFIMGV